MSLLDGDLIRQVLVHDAPWSASHGADAKDGRLGMGLLYYALVHALPARTAVCLGSGGGFVPRMMRQAQRDLGLAEESRTILIDGNVPEAGWGAPTWLNARSFFRRSFADVEIVLERTVDAATRFSAEGMVIDYLHIDADHSFAGCLADFQAYRPLLHPGSVVTLHDSSFPTAGVSRVLDYLRSRDDLEVLDFPEVGADRGSPRVTRDAPSSSRRMVTGAAVEVIALGPPQPGTPSERSWRYLETEAFLSRNVLAAHFVRNCATVIELGGAVHPIDEFLTGEHQAVITVDPLAAEGQCDHLNRSPCLVRHLRGRFQDFAWQVTRPREYGLVMLGLELQGLDAGHWRVLLDLVAQASVTCVEFPTSWGESRAQFERIRAGTPTREHYCAKLDLTGNDVGDLRGSWPPRYDRELHVLVPAGP